jgi:hypothetical protein
MKRLWSLFFVCSILEFSLALDAASKNLAIAQSPSTDSFEDYKKECLQRATSEKLPADVAQELCNCTIARFRSQYTLEEFRALVQKSKSDKTAAQTLTSVGEACFDEVMYEE